MAGFEVTPRRPSSSIMRSSSPEAIRLRRMLSYQMLWPRPSTSTSGFPVLASVVSNVVPLSRWWLAAVSAAELRAGSGDDGVGREAELLLQVLERRGRAERVHAD